MIKLIILIRFLLVLLLIIINNSHCLAEAKLNKGIIAIPFKFFLPTTYIDVAIDDIRTIYAPINTESDFSWIDTSAFEIQLDRLPLKNITKEYHGQQIIGELYEGNFTFSSLNTIVDFPYLMIKRENTTLPFISFGFAYKISNEYYSLMHYLKRHNMINKMIFGLITKST